MMPVQPSPMVLVALRETTVARLTPLLSDGGDETLDAVVDRCIDALLLVGSQPETAEPVLPHLSQPDRATPPMSVSSTWPAANAGAYVVEVLGERVRAQTLGRLFRNVVDAVHDLDPAVIERLATMKAYTRRYVARAPEDVHGGRTDLPTLQTRSGWWVSNKISNVDFKRGLRELCRAGGLDYRRDIRFPA